MTWLAEKWLKLRGWRFVGEMPAIDKMILIGAPHTTNWDFIVYLGAIRHWQITPRYIAKHTLFRWPFGAFFRRFGGIPVDRTRGGGLVGQVTTAFRNSERMILVMAPEGTRSAVPFWKSGFVKIAKDAGVPIVPVYINFSTREVVLGTPIDFDGNERTLMDQLRTFFKAGVGKRPEGAGPIRLKGEKSV